MKRVLSVLLALCMLIGVVPVFTFAEDDTTAEPQPETKQLYANWLEVQTEWDEEQEEDIFHFIKRSDNYGNDFRVLPIDEYGYFVFAIETGEDKYEDVPISELKVSEGAALEEPKSLPEESREFAGKVGKLTVDGFDKDYVISYERGDDVYEIHLNSYTYGPLFYSKPEMDNKNIIPGKAYNVIGEQPVVYLGIKMDPEWNGDRRVKSVALSDGMNGLTLLSVELAVENGAFWQITMDKEAMMDDAHDWTVDVQWEYKDEDGSWVEETETETAGIWVWPESTVAYSTNRLGDNGYTLLKDVKDKLSTELELTAGSKKDIYPVVVTQMEVDGREQWVVYPTFCLGVTSADKNIAAVDSDEIVNSVKPSSRVTAVSAGSAELRYCMFDVGILDETTGEFLVDDDAMMEYLSKIYDGIEGLEPDFKQWYDAEGSLHYSLVIIPNKGDEINHPMDIRRGTEVEGWPEYSITVKVNPAAKFTDVKASDYFADAVNWAVENGITAGVGNNKFGPNQNCTRGQIVTFLWNAAGKPEPESAANPFADVKSGDYYYKAVLWAVENSITSGKTATSFGSNDPCTRAQAMTFIWNAAGKPEPEGAANPFADVKSGDYYYKAVLWAAGNGVTSGKSATSFGSNDPCTRGQIVTFLYNAKDL